MSHPGGNDDPTDDLLVRARSVLLDALMALEAAIADNVVMTIQPLTPHDTRVVEARVASPAALLVAKLHKLGERQQTPNRLVDKDAYDVYRLLTVVATEALSEALTRLLSDDLAGDVTRVALDYLGENSVMKEYDGLPGPGKSLRNQQRRA